ncbi:MAG: phosphotransferase family protein [Hyphomonadaceae bacterium]|nr:phosphotransferase family protein [Hyphomonadaceae bacterium]
MRTQYAPPHPSAMDDLDATRLNALAAKLAPGRDDRVSDLARLSGGASQETWEFRLGDARFILRRAPGGTLERKSGAGLSIEAAVIAAVAAHAVPVPNVRHVLSPEDGLGLGFVVDFVEGETIARKLIRDPAFADVRTHLAADLGRILAAIHNVPVGALPPLRRLGPRATLDALREALDACGAGRPVFELALRWLRDRAPPEPQTLSLVHGDFRLGNLMVSAEGVRAVLDWELVHLGDPMEDLGWLCATPWRFGALEKPVGGVGMREDLFEAYGQVDARRATWWEILASLRWGIICAGMAPLFASGIDRSVERAMIARRASESEIDLLRLMQEHA